MVDTKLGYWKNRKAGKRGQGEPHNPVIFVTEHKPEHMIQIGSKQVLVNRRRARQKQDIKAYRKKGHEYGMKIGNKMWGIWNHQLKKKLKVKQNAERAGHQAIKDERQKERRSISADAHIPDLG